MRFLFVTTSVLGCGFLQIPSRHGHPCRPATIPPVGFEGDFHFLVRAPCRAHQTKSGGFFNLPQVIENNGELWRTRTSDLLIKSQQVFFQSKFVLLRTETRAAAAQMRAVLNRRFYGDKAAANIFVGIESALVVRPYLEKMTRSELLLVLTTGLATVASSTLGVYVAFLTGVFPQIAGHLISASILAIPACVIVAKLLIPETETPETLAVVPPEDESTGSKNLISAIIQGAMDGLKLAAGVSALLIAILGIVALVDKLLGAGSWE
jgi:Na+ dependent nucleoside transporter C-terminus